MADHDRRRARVLFWVVAAAFGVVILSGAMGVWWWGVGFDEAETLGMAKPSTDAAMIASFWIAMAGLALLAVTGVVAAVLERWTRS